MKRICPAYIFPYAKDSEYGDDDLFAALNLVGAQRPGIMGTVFDRIMPRRGAAFDKMLFGAGYRQLTVFKRSGRAPWREVRRLAGDLSENMVLPYELEPPDYIGMFRPSRFERRIVENTAVELLRGTELQLFRRVIGIVDLNGDKQELVRRLLPHCLSVKIYTNEPRNYDSFAGHVLMSYGVPLTVGGSPEIFGDCVLVIDPEGTLKERAGLFLLTSSSRVAKGIISHLRADILGGFGPACDGIDNHLFLAALYELSGSETAGATFASTARLSGRISSFSDIRRELESEGAKIEL